LSRRLQPIDDEMWILRRAKIKQINSTATKSDGMDDGI
jgi:hypothetical protein